MDYPSLIIAVTDAHQQLGQLIETHRAVWEQSHTAASNQETPP